MTVHASILFWVRKAILEGKDVGSYSSFWEDKLLHIVHSKNSSLIEILDLVRIVKPHVVAPLREFLGKDLERRFFVDFLGPHLAEIGVQVLVCLPQPPPTRPESDSETELETYKRLKTYLEKEESVPVVEQAEAVERAEAREKAF